ncbi:O-antigen ligase domain-containing protein [Nonomuraea longispora]|uniref:O-antigen ligase domain-containing protein n=1 Tax=Nonomuraea longispora TaxID=1848320 RepID=A0A4R4NGT5_9ACTN|nr:O-antigen ligase family protein [Nonomuraea longispora]TDC06042.1 O-antigen ligase domain-containing protein [Nonomuraea longispora]
MGALHRPSLVAAATVLLTCLPAGAGGVFGQARVTAADLATVALAAVALALLVASGRAAELPARALVLAPVAGAACIAVLASPDMAASVPGGLRYVQVFVIVPLAVMVTVRDRADRLIVGGAVVGAAAVQGVVGCVQTLTGTGASYAGERVRAVGTFGALDVMGMAGVVSFGVVILLGAGLAVRGRWRAAAFGGAALLCVPLALSLSRGAWLALLCAVLVMVFLHSRVLAARMVLAGAAAGIVLLAAGLGTGSDVLGRRAASIATAVTQPDQSLSDRYTLWRTAAGMWLDHPLTGVGPRRFAELRDTYAPIELSSGSDTDDPVHGFQRRPLLSPHNMYLLTLSEQGLLGLAALGLCLGSLAWWAVRGGAVIAAGLLTWQLADFVYGDIGGPPTLVMSVVLGLVLSRVARPAPSPVTGVPAGHGGTR